MNASADDQLRLLDLQDLDSRLIRLSVRRRGLPALATIAAVEEELIRLRDDLVGHETEITDQGRAAAKIEVEVEQVRSRASRDQQRLDAGSVGTAKELESLQHEIASLARRQSALEDDELEILQLRETAENLASSVRSAITDAEARREAAIAERDSELATIDAEVGDITAQRTPLAGSLPADLVALYDRLRVDRAGVGAAALLRRRCEGCHMELAGNDLTAVRAAPPEEVLRHEDCGRILVRTAESGL